MNKSICSNIKGKAVSLTILCVFSYTISFASVNVGVDRGKSASSGIIPNQSQATFNLKGKVIDDMGEPLPGANIVLVGGTRGVATDIDGSFVISVSVGEKLTVSYLGMEDQIVTVKDKKDLVITMKPKTDELEEVTVVAFAKQKKESVIGSITTLNPSELKVPSSNLTTAMAGRLSGVIAYQRSGEPGKDFSEFWVRGISTFGAGAGALVLIDGIEGNLNTLDPEDIDSFSILKDASSTAVYGVRGANGVVLVTTKKGKAGKLNLQVKANAGISYSPRMLDFVNAAQYAQLANEASVTRGGIPIYTDVDLALYANHMDPDLHPDVNWKDVILKDYTWNLQYFLSASGGGEVARYYISAGYTTKDAIFKQDKGVNRYNTNVNYNKFNFRANVDVNVTPTTTLSLNEETVIVTQN